MRDSEERWKELCGLAAKEQDPIKLRELIREINDLLIRKRDRLDAEPQGKKQND